MPPSGDHAPLLPQLHTPGSALQSEAATPLVSRSSSFSAPAGFAPLSAIANDNAKEKKANGHAHAPTSGTDFASTSGIDFASLVPAEEPDGATLHCVSVSELCFKIGRITVPPALVFAMEGFSRRPDAPSSSSTPAEKPKPYSHANPPPSYRASLALQAPDLARGHLKTLQRFLRQGWRDVPEGARWWEDALGKEVEERRQRNLELVKGVREGMSGAAVCLH